MLVRVRVRVSSCGERAQSERCRRWQGRGYGYDLAEDSVVPDEEGEEGGDEEEEAEEGG